QINDDGDTASLPIVASDPENDPLTFSATGLPPGLSIDPASGLIAGIIDNGGVPGDFSVSVSVTDDPSDASRAVSVPFTWTVTVNAPPSVTSPGDQINDDGDTVSVPIVASDPESDPLTFGATGLPPGLSIDPASGLISGTIDNGGVPGDFNISVSVTDDPSDASRAVSTNFIWSINANEAPNADAGDDQNTLIGSSVTLDGSQSFDPDGDMITYRWGIVSVPPNSGLTVADIVDAQSPIAMLMPDVEGTYELELEVSDGQATDVDTVLIVAQSNAAPNAVVEPTTSTVAPMTEVILDASASNDPDDRPAPLTFVWRVIFPPQSSLTMGDVDIDGDMLRFTPDVEGDYRVEVVVDDGLATDTATAEVEVSLENLPPIADAGGDASGTVGEAVDLDGSASSDPDGSPEPLGYRWQFVSVALGSALTNADIESASTAQPSFIPDVAGMYVLELRVFDGLADDFDSVVIDVREVQSPSIEIETRTEGADADDPPGPTLLVGDTVTWAYEVTNIGNTPLANVVVEDDQNATVACPTDSLGVGESTTCTAVGIVLPGQFATIGLVTATSPAGALVTDSDPSHYFGEAPALVCDLDVDRDVDRDDIAIIFAARGQAASPGDPRDIDGNGLITVNDARACVLQCTNLRCAP
ncbi:MAG: putative Ig domain-containing protein, partial [Pseudomonadota bacterium]